MTNSRRTSRGAARRLRNTALGSTCITLQPPPARKPAKMLFAGDGDHVVVTTACKKCQTTGGEYRGVR